VGIVMTNSVDCLNAEPQEQCRPKRIDPLILFRMLIPQQLYNLNDEDIEFQVNDTRSFEEFIDPDNGGFTLAAS